MDEYGFLNGISDKTLYIGLTDIEDYIILGKDSISYFVYDIASEKYRILTNGTLDVMNEFNSLAQMIREVLV